ncbi:PIN domain-containing protein [Desulfovibrio sp. TomC]|jgi:predicted nucleic acid-binding protein|uniref:PIN domain-containing protein n=1 Tax=Desulfovibrio sp. TomC TaxID=1562888 RepID=UPI0005BB8A7A|nr:PIN domain-containing protein [Desulfovibrio sp. TomC]
MLFLISDANILIDIQTGELLASMFSLDFQFAVPDILFYEELEEQHGHFVDMGLIIQSLDSLLVKRVEDLARIHRKPSRNDLFALALAEHRKCPLLTGDDDLRQAATREEVQVYGTIWLIEQMIIQGRITATVARNAYSLMKKDNRRLPWRLAESRLQTIESKS